jgi:toxin ParE1/3/4
MKPVIIDAEAEAELAAAAAYLERNRKGYGRKFRTEAKRVFARIRRNPKQFPAYGDKGHCMALLQQFPYTIYFAELDDAIWIAAIAHQSRRPGYWMDRTSE